MPDIEFVGQSARDSGNPSASTSRLINLYREPVVVGSLTQHVLRNAPGATQITELGAASVRAMASVNGSFYAVCDGVVSKITPANVVTSIGAVDDGPEVSIAGNNGAVAVVSGGKYYLHQGNSLTQPVSGAFDAFGSVEYLGGYTVLSQLGGRMIQWSALAQPESLPGLNFATAEAKDDLITRLMVVNDVLWIFKPGAIELWVGTGLASAQAFQAMTGGVHDVGLLAFDLMAKLPNSAAFVGSDGVVYVTSGTGMQPISTPPLHVAIKTKGPERLFYFEEMGHKFIAITFANAPAWVYDIATGEWAERANGHELARWNTVAAASIGSKTIVGTRTGKIGEVTGRPVDFGEVLIRKAVSKTLRMEKPLRVKSIEFRGDYGSEATEALIGLRLSHDGVTFGDEKTRSMGALGQYDKRAIFRACGMFRNLTAEITISADVDMPIWATATLEAV